MEGSIKNVYEITFKDGTNFKSDGHNETIRPSIDSEMNWLSFHIQKEINSLGKTLADVKTVKMTLDIDVNEKES